MTPEAGVRCYTERCPPPVSPLGQYGRCGVQQIAPPEINARVSLLVRSRSRSLEVGLCIIYLFLSDFLHLCVDTRTLIRHKIPPLSQECDMWDTIHISGRQCWWCSHQTAYHTLSVFSSSNFRTPLFSWCRNKLARQKLTRKYSASHLRY